MALHADKMVAQLAAEMAGAIYEELMARNHFYDAWKRNNPKVPHDKLQAHWIKAKTKLYLPRARATLATMLASNIAEPLKEQIKAALIRDHAVRKIRVPSRRQ